MIVRFYGLNSVISAGWKFPEPPFPSFSSFPLPFIRPQLTFFLLGKLVALLGLHIGNTSKEVGQMSTEAAYHLYYLVISKMGEKFGLQGLPCRREFRDAHCPGEHLVAQPGAWPRPWLLGLAELPGICSSYWHHSGPGLVLRLSFSS